MCDCLCAIGADGLLFAKNSDRPPREAQVFAAFDRRPGGGTLRTQYLELADVGAAAFVGSRPTWLWGVEHGLNQHGVAIGNEKIWTIGRPHDRPAALLGMDLVRLGLERAHTAVHALEVMTGLIEEHGQGGSGEPEANVPYDSSFLIADASGAWVLETCDRTWVAKSAPTGAAISNRVSVEHDWSRSSSDVPPGANFQDWRHPNVPTTIADHRLAATTACISRGVALLDPATVVGALRDHGNGPWGLPGASPMSPHEATLHPIPTHVRSDHRGVTVCMHVGAEQATTASMVCTVGADPTQRRAWVALGSPCVSIYVPIFPDVGVPAALSSPSTWSRFATLRDQTTADPATLGSVRDCLAPVEAELWDRADAASDAGHASRVAYTASASDPVERVLTKLAL